MSGALWRPAVLCMALLVLSCPAMGAEASRAVAGPFQVHARSGAGWTVEYKAGSSPTASLTIAGRLYSTYAASVPDNAPAGSPQLPSDVLYLGVPLSSSLTVEIQNPVYETVADQAIAPVPTFSRTDKDELVPDFLPNPTVYAANRFIPENLIEVAPPVTIRRQRIAAVRVYSTQYNPAARITRRLVSATLSITLTGTSSTMASGASLDDPWFEQIYHSMLANYDEARQWRIPEPVPIPGSASGDSTGLWFDPAKSYVKIPVAEDGWYHVSSGQLRTAGMDLSLSDIASGSLFAQGRSVPFVVGLDSSIGFYGVRKRGGRASSDPFTDTTTYMFTRSGRGTALAPSVTNNPGNLRDVFSAVETRHFEQNTDYYEGTGEIEVTQNEDVPGEGWVWEYYYPGTDISHSFDLEALDSATATATLRIRLYSTTSHSATPDHRARIWVNDSLLSEISFNGRSEANANIQVPMRLLRASANILRILSVPTAASVNQFYLDWFEIDYARRLVAVGDQVAFHAVPRQGNVPVRYAVSGFSNPDIRVFDVGNGRELLGGVVSGDSTAGFLITVQDTLSSASLLVAVARGGEKVPGPLAPKTFVGLRSNSKGADYIVVTHANFLAAARRLAAHRQAVDGVRTAIVDVQDIYDEFNYGSLDPAAIKKFLEFAWSNWPRPAPSFLLLFGDASWDCHRYMATTTKTNYVPGYGVPTGDNWFGCFDADSLLIPSLMIGRLPVQDADQADRVVSKVIGYDLAPPADWNKEFLCISGGVTTGEQVTLNAMSDAMINTFLVSPPVGGSVTRVYKSTPAAIDGEHRQFMRDVMKKGIGFLNFLGHSGGRTWGVDIGSPYDLENTNGALPFISSVSCNVGAFAEPSGTVLSEDFVLAENRGAIAVWGSSSLGYANTGATLVNYFLGALTSDTVRALGALTTAARYKLYLGATSNPIVRAHVSLTPLIGDPMTRYALAKKPELAVGPGDVELADPTVAADDSTAAVTVRMHNFGLVPQDSVGLSLTDLYNGNTTPLLTDLRIAPLRHRDSVTVLWRIARQPGRHLLTAVLDPSGIIDEVTKLDNAVQAEEYVYGEPLAVVRPRDNEVTMPGIQRLVVAGGAAMNVGANYTFELDTVATFNSPWRVVSGEVPAGVVSGEWRTASLPPGKVFFWRARTVVGTILGRWVTSCFITSNNVTALPVVRLHQQTAGQWERDQIHGLAATDSGVTVTPATPLKISSTSMGYRGGLANHKYSTLGVNDQVVWGYEWVVGVGFIAMRIDKNSAVYDFRPFDVARHPEMADSMSNFIEQTPDGQIVAIAVVFDGRSNVSERLKQAVDALGATQFRKIVSGQSWAFLARKGDPLTARESLTDDSAKVIMEFPSYFAVGSGSVTTQPLPAASIWKSFHWRPDTPPGTNAHVAVIGTTPEGRVDTLGTVPSDSNDSDIAWLNARMPAARYRSISFTALLSTSDALVSPRLAEWWVDCIPPPDPAISARTLGPLPPSIRRGGVTSLPVTVHNIGYRMLDSAALSVGLYDNQGTVHTLVTVRVDMLPPDSSRLVVVPVPTLRLSRQSSLVCRVEALDGGDLVSEDNTGLISVTIDSPPASTIHIFSDGTQLMDGDYVPLRPKITVRSALTDSLSPLERRISLAVDNVPAGTSVVRRMAKTAAPPEESNDPEFRPALSEGRHELRISIVQLNETGSLDSLERTLVVNVSAQTRILNLFNYPNPFARETDFTFVVTGSVPPENATVRIFTVAGRKIMELAVPPGDVQVGFNRVHWDGRDMDGDEVANGYYFYQVSLQSGEKNESVIGKLAKVR